MKLKIRFYILHYKPIYSGAAGSLSKLVKALDKYKFDIEILTTHKDGLSKIEYIDGVKIIRVGGGPFGENGMLRGMGKIRFSISSFFYNLIYNDYDIIHFIGVGKVAFLSLLVSKIYGKKILTKPTRTGDDDAKTLYSSLIGKIIINLLKNDSGHWIISKELYNFAVQYTKWDKDKMLLMTNPVDIEYQDFSLLQSIRKKVKQSQVRFLFVGLISRNKGVDLLLNIWENNEIDADLILCGPMDINDSELENRVRRLIVQKRNIIWEGMVDNQKLRKYYLESSCFLFPTLREGMPNVVLEAISYGLPVFTNKLVGVTDFILGEDTQRGILIEGNDEKEYLKFINLFINFEEFRQECNNKSYLAHKWVLEHSESRMICKKIENLYTKIMK